MPAAPPSVRPASLRGPAFRSALLSVPAFKRDGWIDDALGLGEMPEDVSPLPREAVPYLPCPVDVLLRLADEAPVRAEDLFLDLGAGIGRPGVIVHLLTGARALGVELQPHLVELGRAHLRRLGVSGRVDLLEGNAAELLPEASVVLLYSPFNGETLVRVCARLEQVAQSRPLTVCAVDLDLPALKSFVRRPSGSPSLVFYDGGRER